MAVYKNIFILSRNRNSRTLLKKIKILFCNLKQNFLKEVLYFFNYFYIHLKQKSLKKVLYIYLKIKLIKPYCSQKHQSLFICEVVLFFYVLQYIFLYLTNDHVVDFCFYFLQIDLYSFMRFF